METASTVDMGWLLKVSILCGAHRSTSPLSFHSFSTFFTFLSFLNATQLDAFISNDFFNLFSGMLLMTSYFFTCHVFNIFMHFLAMSFISAFYFFAFIPCDIQLLPQMVYACFNWRFFGIILCHASYWNLLFLSLYDLIARAFYGIVL